MKPIAFTDDTKIWYEGNGSSFRIVLRGGGGEWDNEITRPAGEETLERTIAMFRDAGFDLTPEGEALLEEGGLE